MFSPLSAVTGGYPCTPPVDRSIDMRTKNTAALDTRIVIRMKRQKHAFVRRQQGSGNGLVAISGTREI